MSFFQRLRKRRISKLPRFTSKIVAAHESVAAVIPFGKEIKGGGGPGSCLMNVVWILLFGWELFLSSVAVGLVYCVTIVGIPLGLQSFKLARLALFPFGSAVV